MMNDTQASAVNHTLPTLYFKTLTLDELRSSDERVSAKFKEMLQDGFFYLEMPASCKERISEGIAFANSFYLSEEVKNIKLTGFGGYHDRQKDGIQVESHFAGRTDWSFLIENKIYTPHLVDLAREMNQLGIEVLRKSLELLEIPQVKWDELTGALASDDGAHHFSFNHYRKELAVPGLSAHRDLGYITVLYTNKMGLEGMVNENWQDVPPLTDHFIINFGQSMQILTERDGTVNAIEHRVRMVTEDRIAFGIFLDGREDLPFYSYNRKSNIQTLQHASYKKYMTDLFAKAYKNS